MELLAANQDDIYPANAWCCVGHAAAVVKVPAFSVLRTLSMCVSKASRQ